MTHRHAAAPALDLHAYVAVYDPGPLQQNRVLLIVAASLAEAADVAETEHLPVPLARLEVFQAPLRFAPSVAPSLGVAGYGSVAKAATTTPPFPPMPAASEFVGWVSLKDVRLTDDAYEAILGAARLEPVSPPGMTRHRIETAVKDWVGAWARGM